MNTKHGFEFETFNENIKKSQKAIWFAIGMMAGIAISCMITGVLIYLVD